MRDKEVFTISVPTDEDGYILLVCPLCGELFKLEPSDFQDDSVLDVYCPGCGLVSDNYISEDVIQLGMTMAENYANGIITKELERLERKSKGGFLEIKVKNKWRKKAEMPIMFTVDALERKMYSCCKLGAKIKPILNMGGSYCPYCGVIDYGDE